MCDIEGLLDKFAEEAIYDSRQNTPLSRQCLRNARKDIFDEINSLDELAEGYKKKVGDLESDLRDEQLDNNDLTVTIDRLHSELDKLRNQKKEGE